MYIYVYIYFEVYIYIYLFIYIQPTSCPSSVPTLKLTPSLTPTAGTIPTTTITFQPSTVIPDGLSYSALTFNSEIIIPGLDSTVMSAEEGQLAFRTALANVMEGVRIIDVMITSISSVDVRRGLKEHNFVDRSYTRSEIFDTDHMSRSLAVGTSVKWNVTAPLTRLGASGANSYSTLKTGLTTAMGPTGSFLTTVKRLSTSFSSASTATIAVNDAFRVITISQPTAAPTSSPTIPAIIPTITLNVTTFRTNMTLDILLTKSRIVDNDISGKN
jgi:hypothetical protein